MKLKDGKEEITYLISKVIDKYESESGEQIVRNTNRKNYESISIVLSEISNNLPYTAEEFDHEPYEADEADSAVEYPYRKLDITTSQIKDACLGIVSNPRNFMVDACYIYLYEVGRKGFEKNPVDENLIDYGDEALPQESGEDELSKLQRENKELRANFEEEKSLFKKSIAGIKRKKTKLTISTLVLLISLISITGIWLRSKKEWQTMKKDMSILPYQPTQQEIDSLEGIWVCYTASPQARRSNPNRYHLVVLNVVDVAYKNGYFTFDRFGASFNHKGYMQYEAPGLVSIHSFVKNNKGVIESPRHSLIRLDKNEKVIPAISASWSFDVGDRNNIIGIREIYIKQGKEGTTSEVLNTLENAKCNCKIVKWTKDGKLIQTYYLRNELMDTMSNQPLKRMLEKSILLREPDTSTIIKEDHD